jgi:tetratricopeptide (TPR) repeat protein
MNRTVHRFTVAMIAVSLVTAGAACRRDPTQRAAKYANSGDAYVKNQQWAEAIIEYGNALKATPEAADIHYKLARAYEASGDITKAYKEYARAADLAPSNLDAQMRAGNILLSAGEFQMARTRAELALKTSPNHVPALILLGNASAGLKDIRSAVEQIQQAIDLDPASAPAWSALGALRLLRGREAEAGTAFQKAVELAPKSPEAHLALAGFQWAKGARNEAEATLKTILAIDAASAPAHRALALLFLSLGRAPEAEPHFRALATDARGRLALADFYAGLNKKAEALRVLRELEKDPEKAAVRSARLREAGLLYASGQKTEAHQIVDGLLQERARNVDARLVKARMLLGDGAAGDAASHAREAVKADGGNAAPHYVLGLALAAQRDFSGAERAFEEVTRLNPRAAAAQMQLARLRLARGDASNAVTAAEAAVQARPDDIQGAVLLSQSLRATGQYDRAARALKGTLASAPDAVPLQVENGWVALERKDIDAARAAFTHVLANEPLSFDAKSGLVAADIAERKIENARAHVAGWRSEAPGDARLRLLQARVEIAGGELTSAATLLTALVTEDPSQLDAYHLLGAVYAAQDRVGEAIAQYQRLAERSPLAATGAGTMIGMLKEEQSDQAGARSAYEQVVGKDPRAGVAANNLAWIYAEEGKLDDALRLATSARDAMGRRPEPEDTLGWVYLKKGLAADAVAAFERALERAPNRPIYHYHAGLAYLKTGDKRRARAALMRALTLEPQFSGAADARARVADLK